MPKAYDSWKVLPHDALDKLNERVWRLEGELQGMDLRRVLTIAKRGDGKLVIHNAIALEQEMMKEIEAWGEPAYLVVPNGYHRLDAKVFKDRYPNIRVLCPRGARKKVEQVVEVDGDYDDYPADEHVKLVHIAGIASAEGAMLVHADDGVTLVLNDLLFNMPHGTGFGGFVFRHVTQSTGGPRISRIFRWLVLKDAASLRRDMERLADTPNLKRIIVAHHEVIDEDPAGVLRRVAATL